MKKKVDITFFDAKPYDEHFFQRMNEEYGFTFRFIDSRLSNQTISLAQNSRAVCIFVNDQGTKEILEQLTAWGVEVLALRCAGYNNVDLHAAKNKIPVVRVPAYSPYAVAEHSLALILTLNRKTHRAYYRTRDNNFRISGLMGFDMKGKTIGIVGTGKIGQAFLKIISGFGMNVLAYDKYPEATLEKKLSFRYVDLPELLQQSDIISLHCPLTKDTEHLINESSIEMMKKGVMLINTSRGALVSTKALISGLKQRKIGAAGLDVYEEEEHYFFEDYSSHIIADDELSRLLTFPNVLITSHQGFFTEEALTNIARTTLENISEAFRGDTLTNEVTLD